MEKKKGKMNKIKSVDYSKWGYLFILPFFLAFFIFQLIPLVSTVYYSFFEYYRSGLKEIGPNFVGLANYKTLLTTDLPKFTGNTFILWILGFLPQIIVSLVLAAWFTDARLRIKGKQFFMEELFKRCTGLETVQLPDGMIFTQDNTKKTKTKKKKGKGLLIAAITAGLAASIAICIIFFINSIQISF